MLFDIFVISSVSSLEILFACISKTVNGMIFFVDKLRISGLKSTRTQNTFQEANKI
jgi:hypothetical protein